MTWPNGQEGGGQTGISRLKKFPEEYTKYKCRDPRAAENGTDSAASLMMNDLVPNGIAGFRVPMRKYRMLPDRDHPISRLQSRSSAGERRLVGKPCSCSVETVILLILYPLYFDPYCLF